MNTANETPGEQIIGLRFFVGTARQAAQRMVESNGCAMMPASPALLKLNYDVEYRAALQAADLVLPDSELLAGLWKLLGQGTLHKISGIDYLNALLEAGEFTRGQSTLWVVENETARDRATTFLEARGITMTPESFVVTSRNAGQAEDHAVLLAVERLRPRHVILALRAGHQEKLGIYLREYVLSRPSIHCIGAALALLSGEETPIPHWARRSHLGWLARLVAQPSMIIPRLGIAAAFVVMVLRYRSALPPLRTRWTDL